MAAGCRWSRLLWPRPIAMSAQLARYLLTGLTVGAIYALVTRGFASTYNASRVFNFTQDDFIMIAGMVTVLLANPVLPPTVTVRPLEVEGASWT